MMIDRTYNRSYQRRGTILVMVVTILALLFIIVTGFLSSARVQEQITNDLSRGDQTDTIVTAVEELAVSAIIGQMAGSDGQIASGDARESWATIPGGPGSEYLASLEPVFDEGRPDTVSGIPQEIVELDKLVWPAVTSFDALGALPPRRSVIDLIPEFEFDMNDPVLGDESHQNLRFFTISDLQAASLAAFNDATGDGIPDSDIILGRRATLLANSMAGNPVMLPGADAVDSSFAISRIRRDNNLQGMRANAERQWRRFLQDMRYTTASRVIAHGGMISMDAPSSSSFNRDFSIYMFDQIANPADVSGLGGGRRLSELNLALQNRFFELLNGSRNDVEYFLRSRFLLPPQARNDIFSSGPAILGMLQGEYPIQQFRYPRTFGMTLRENRSRGAERASQRFNLGNPQPNTTLGIPDYRAYQDAVTMRPRFSNSGTGIFQPGGFPSYRTSAYEERWTSRRHVLTMHSFSDELARKQDAAEPADAINLTGDSLRLFRGETKFYLGDIAQAFDGNGNFDQSLISDVQSPFSGKPKGAYIAERLARYFGEMIRSYQGFAVPANGDLDGGIPNDNERAIRGQAFMLAVNAIAFASPRQADGYFDPIVYTDQHAGPTPVTYVGYSPQPFLTEAIAYWGNYEQYGDSGLDPDDDVDSHLAVGIEIFNPHDSLRGSDSHDLNLDHFRLVVSDNAGSPPLVGSPLSGVNIGRRLPGRAFFAYAFEYDAPGLERNRYFSFKSADPDFPVSVRTSGDFDPDATEIVVRLQRYRRIPEQWITIDEMRIDMPDRGPSAPQNWSSRYRDVSPAPFFGGLLPARWNMVTAIDQNDSFAWPNRVGSVTGGSDPYNASGGLPTLGSASVADNNNPAIATGPLTPMITMNADPRLRILAHENSNDLRPSSYPTVGFMLMLPRFSHTSTAAGSTPMSVRLWNTYSASQRDYHSNPEQTPVDFGHIPSLDNFQAVNNSSPFSRTEAIPWGLLVYDYFTTVDPSRPGHDPLRIPGRIDINTAPWWVIAKLPMFGPDSDGYMPFTLYDSSPAPHQVASSSFWDPDVGIMTVNQTTGTFPRTFLIPPSTGGVNNPQTGGQGRPVRLANGIYKLGNWLAQSVIGYRDRIQILPTDQNDPWLPYAGSWLRNGQEAGAPPAFNPYRATEGSPSTNVYGPMRGQHENSFQRGFLTIGELLNVKGWDGTEPSVLTGTQTATTWPVAQSGIIGTGQSPTGDYLRAVSTLVLLDSHYLTTRSNTFTIYTSLIDRSENGQARSIRSQKTIDRGNLLPLIQYRVSGGVRVPWLKPAAGPGGTVYVPVRITNDDGKPAVISERRGSYFNTSEF